MLLTICHRTVYRYARPVALLPHRMMMCPRNQHDMKLVSNALHCSPAAVVEWTQDVFGNLIATANFARPVETLSIVSNVAVDQSATAWPVFRIAPSAHHFPFTYSADDVLDMGILRVVTPDPDPSALTVWLDQFRARAPQDTLDLLKTINARIAETMAYRARDEEGTQLPSETLSLKSGSCRDLATLFIEAVRQLGFGARAVSGYAYDPDSPIGATTGQGTTHAWAEVYLPCAGWIAFDPTASRVGNLNLIPVAVARSISQIRPIEGHYTGEPGDFLSMDVHVSIVAEKNGAAAGSQRQASGMGSA